MNPQNNGRYCGSCAKVVVDFTSKSEQEIIQHIRDAGAARVCGRVRTAHLSIGREETIRLRNFLAALLLAFGTTLFSCGGPEKKIAPPSEETMIMGLMVSPVTDSMNIKTVDLNDESNIVPTLPPPVVITNDCEVSTMTGEIELPDIMVDSVSADEEYVIADQIPVFKGDNEQLLKYVRSSLDTIHFEEHPPTIYAQFLVKHDGTIGWAKILRSGGKAADAAVLKMISQMPPFQPALIHGTPVNFIMNLPVKITWK
jgi:hypothetical protein